MERRKKKKISMNAKNTEQTVNGTDEKDGNMKIIGLVASPRKEGNTSWITNKILEGAKVQGALPQSWYFSDLNIKPCQSCYGCQKGYH
jgi:hypothetical protein